MQEVKKPSKKPLIYYFGMILLVLCLLNMTLFPRLLGQSVNAVTYDVFMSMTEEKKIAEVEIRDDEIVFTDQDGKVYKTTATEDPNRTERLYQAGAKFQEIETQPSLLSSILLTWVLPFLPFLLIGFFLNKRMKKMAGGQNGMMFGMSGGSGA